MTDKSEWTGRVGASWAGEWQRTDRSFRPLTERLLEATGAAPFARALDIGCGAGEITYWLAASNPSSNVVGADISEDLVAVARERTAGLTNASIELSDVSSWAAADAARPDLLISRHGVMFFADPVAAFAHLSRAAKNDARLVFSCFRSRRENLWVSELAGALPPENTLEPERYAPGPFAFGKREFVEDILSQAGWHDIGLEAIDYPMLAGEGENAVDDALSYFLRIGPAARVVAMMDQAKRDEAIPRLRAVIERHQDGASVALPAAGWLVTARSPG
ncbi:class I SAM-dependent methyltransferase [Qipengyuania zhejiangensis]|uniref:class I SAM-dependent methyltransferase n=1 Tax=Qipengyuania zhejiangensis TaxID=3077782 RepID=UPI002D79349A|nr:class I SAM-dependent methyltransferase [Qipengyuania sp. Z2]